MKFRIQRHWRWLVALGAVFVPGIVVGAFSVPHQFKAGTPIKASEMNANFDALSARLDALTNPPAAAAIGKLTLEGVATDLPINKFSQSLQVTWTPGSTPTKPKFSEIVVTRSAGAGTPPLNLRVAQGSLVPSASIVLGSLTIALDQVRVTSSSVSEPRGGLPQESFGLSFTAIKWTWSDGVNPATEVSYTLPSNTGGSGATTAFTFGYFPPGVTPDPAYVSITGYTHQIACVTPVQGCKPAHGAVSVKKLLGADSLGEIGLLLVAKQATVNLDWFKDESTVNNGVSLEKGLVTGVDITTGDDGSLNESATFGYGQITWKAGNVVAGWDVLANAPL